MAEQTKNQAGVTEADECFASLIMRHVLEHADWCAWDLAWRLGQYRLQERAQALLEYGLSAEEAATDLGGFAQPLPEPKDDHHG